MGRTGSAWVAQPGWVTHLQTYSAELTLRGSRSPGGSLCLKLGRAPSCHIVHFSRSFSRPSQCPNRACDGSLEIYWSLLSNTSGIMQFGFHLPCQKSNLPTLVKMSRMRLPQGRALLKSTFEGLPQLQMELMIAHWKGLAP